jgi:hypothetical protein
VPCTRNVARGGWSRQSMRRPNVCTAARSGSDNVAPAGTGKRPRAKGKATDRAAIYRSVPGATVVVPPLETSLSVCRVLVPAALRITAPSALVTLMLPAGSWLLLIR